MSSGSAFWILWLTPMDWLALSIGRSGSQPLEYSKVKQIINITRTSGPKVSQKEIFDDVAIW